MLLIPACFCTPPVSPQGASCAPVFNFVLRKAAEARQFDAVVALLSSMRSSGLEVDPSVASLVRRGWVGGRAGGRVVGWVGGWLGGWVALPRLCQLACVAWRAFRTAGVGMRTHSSPLSLVTPVPCSPACPPLPQVWNAQAEPARPLAPGPGTFTPAASPSPSLPAPLPPPSPMAGMPPPLAALPAEPALSGPPALFASLPGFAASMGGDRSPALAPTLAPPPPPSPHTPAAYATAASPVGSPSPAPAFSLADANALLDAMKVGCQP